MSADNAGEQDEFLYDSSEVETQSVDEQLSVDESNADTEAKAQNNDDVTVYNNNCASLLVDQDVVGNSGNNDASDNEGSEMGTGNVSTASHTYNEGNVNQVEGDRSSNADDQNSDQGGSTNSVIEDEDGVTVENNNKIYLENDVDVESNSGGNTMNDNDGNAELSTGDIDMIVTLMNILNMNITGEDFTHLIVNIFGDLSGEVDLD